MSYAAISDLQTAIGSSRLIEICDFDGNGTLDTTTATTALSEASAICDSYIAAYLPITAPPQVLVRATVNIAVHLLRVGRDMTTEDSRRAYEDALSWLKDVSRGLASLPSGESPGEAVNSSAMEPICEADTRLFTSSTMGRFL